MTHPKSPAGETRRLEELRSYGLLDTLPDQALDDLTRLAAHICEVPIAMISLIDERRQWFKSRIGIDATETPREVAFCAHAILDAALMIVPDALDDARFVDNPLVTGEPNIRFYAGMPLVTPSGHALGTLCVIDRRPRQLTPRQEEALHILSRQAMAQLELRRQAQELIENEARLFQVFRNTPVAIAIHRWSDRTFVDVNAAFTALLGWTRDEVVGRTSVEVGLVLPQTAAGLRSSLEQSHSVRDTEIAVITRSGETRHVLMGSEVVELRREAHALTTFVDITERKRTEARFRRLVDSNAQGVIFWNTKGGITGANDAFLQMVGYSRADLEAGRIRWLAMTPPEYAELDRRALATIAVTGVCQPFEKEYIRKDGTRVPVLIGAAIFEGEPEDGVCYVVDVTERKALERQLLRAQRMESLGTLAGGIAHDLNNVLAPILMSIELLSDMTTRDEDRQVIDTLQTSAQRGADLVRQVLSFARGVEGERISVNPLHLMHDLIKVMHDTFPKNITVAFVPSAELPTLTGDPTQIHQVLLNLLVNARDAMPNGGTLTISMENVELDDAYAAMHLDAQPGAYVLVTVADNGTGIAPAHRDRIFEPFFTTKEVGHGTGLGLSTSLAIVKSHHGFIHLYSELGRGTTFKVYLPANTAAAGAAELGARTPPRLPRGRGELVLVVDDEQTVRDIVLATLERFGYRVVLASHGAEAVAVFAQRRSEIAVVLTDMAMPVMDGPSTIVALRAIEPAVKIIGSSGQPANSAAGSRVDHFVAKPYTADTLLTALELVLGR